MKNRELVHYFITHILKTAVLFLAFSLCIMHVHVSAEVDPVFINKASSSLVNLGILKGDSNGNLKLDNKISRCEFLTMVIRMMGYDNIENTEDISISFTDLSTNHWAYNNMKFAVKTGLIKGYPDNTVGLDNCVEYAEAQAILIRALGYENTLSGKWPENVVNKAAELGLANNINTNAYKQLSRGEASLLIYNALVVDFNR